MLVPKDLIQVSKGLVESFESLWKFLEDYENFQKTMTTFKKF